jgi:hypothetical protein
MLIGLGAMLFVSQLVSAAWTWYVSIGTTVTFISGLLLSKLLRETPE